MIEVVAIADELTKAQLVMPHFAFLVPDQHRFTLSLYQPLADIEYGIEFGLRNRDQPLAEKQFVSFLKAAHATGMALIVCPEYSCPWAAIFKAIDSGSTPVEGRLWALGCEATTRAKLAAVRQQCAERSIAVICAEPVAEEDGRRFFDPICFLFVAKTNIGDAKLVMAIQFKTEPMGDPISNFEPNLLILGTTIYKFRNKSVNSIVLYTLLCSDVLAYAKGDDHPLDELLRKEEPALILHPQLNPEPRHQDYARYRDYCVRNRDKDVICLNWSRNARLRSVNGAELETWRNSGASAIYSKKWLSKVETDRAESAHKKGVYVTHWKEPRAIAVFLNFDPMIFNLSLTKVSQSNATQAQRSHQIPEVLSVKAWNGVTSEFSEEEADRHIRAIDGSAGTFIPSDQLKSAGMSDEFISEFANNPIALERLISLTTNQLSQDSMGEAVAWPSFEAVDSFALGGALETIQRLTFVQDTTREARHYRARAMKAFGEFFRAKKLSANFPDHLKTYAAGSPIVLENPSCVNMRSNSAAVGLFVFDLDIGDAEDAEDRLAKLKDFVIAQKLSQSIRKLKLRAKFSEDLIDDEHVLLWYSRVNGETGASSLHYAPKDFVRKINEVGPEVPSEITAP